MDKIILYGIIAGIALGIVVSVVIVNSSSSPPSRSPEEAERIVQGMYQGYEECSRQYGVIGEQVNACFERVRAYYGQP